MVLHLFKYAAILAGSLSVLAQQNETHCRETMDCPMYPYDACFAETQGLVCHSIRDGGFEMAINMLYTFVYVFNDMRNEYMNDTGMPCFSIPRSPELDHYVHRRGPVIINEADLDLIGNCTSDSFCDPQSKTCQPKRDVGEPCQYNMQCHFNMRRFPGHCSNTSVCVEREDAAQYLYGPAFRTWKIGDHWQNAVIALSVTAAIVICVFYGRQQAHAMVGGVQVLIEKWQSGSSRRNTPEDDDEAGLMESSSAAIVPTPWYTRLPGYSYFSHRFRPAGEGSTYIQLAGRERTEEPPAYRD
ncbi:hypothetical protein VKS41_003241 [Umbelopsis sp. WA50703]